MDFIYIIILLAVLVIAFLAFNAYTKTDSEELEGLDITTNAPVVYNTPYLGLTVSDQSKCTNGGVQYSNGWACN
jgi:hypothetical protein